MTVKLVRTTLPAEMTSAGATATVRLVSEGYEVHVDGVPVGRIAKVWYATGARWVVVLEGGLLGWTHALRREAVAALVAGTPYGIPA